MISTVEENEPRTAFDKALKAVEGQLKRQKTRMIDSKRKSSAESNLPESPETPIPEDEDTEE